MINHFISARLIFIRLFTVFDKVHMIGMCVLTKFLRLSLTLNFGSLVLHLL